jgi:ribosomal protein L7/L12
VLRPSASVETAGRVAAGVRAAVEAAGAIAPSIEVEPVATIAPEPGSAKLKVVKTVREAAA